MSALLQDPMIAGQVSKPLLSVRSEMNAELRGEDKAATSDSELNEPLLAPVESNDSEDTPSKLFVTVLHSGTNFKDLDSFPPLMIWKRKLEVVHLKFEYVTQKEHLDSMEITSLTEVL
uniref:Uncharacterized protein n=1 Tax=Rousettus aegyptiacus TaxID=9407 RepID=A0A7J8D7Q0_ROUAE|nr:hypothetical protein HJG63_015680 [Rousettus aegyptiacus]